MGTLVFNGISSKDLGLVIQAPPEYDVPEREYTAVHVPGKNGDVIIDNGSFRNSNRNYYLAKVFTKNTTFSQNALTITDWLHSAKGYARLEDTYEPEYYRMASYNEQNSMRNYYDVATVINISFNCKPQRWLKSGDVFIDTSVTNVLNNPTTHDASPFIEIELISNKEASVTFTNGSYTNTITIDAPTSVTTIYLDCELMEAYDSDGNSYNLKIHFSNGIPILYSKSETKITSSNTSSVRIKPRWWTV